MDHARPLRYPVGRSQRLETFALVLWTCGATALGGWLVATSATGAISALAALLVIVVGVLSGAACRSLVGGELCWDGRTWHLDARPGKMDVIADGQNWILFRWRCDGIVRWGMAESASAQHLWCDLRRTVYSRADHNLQGDSSAK